MLRTCLILLFAIAGALCAKPYSGRIKIAEETLLQAKDRSIPYAEKLDAAISGSPADFREFILLSKKLDTAAAYFHYFHIYEAAELAGDGKLKTAVESLAPSELDFLLQGLAEARGWLKRKKSFAESFPQTAAFLRKSGKTVNF